MDSDSQEKESNLEDILDFDFSNGGMGIAISDYNLAREVSKDTGFGIVSGVTIDHVLVARLQAGNEEVKEALSHFPNKDVADRIINEYYVEGGVEKKDYKRSEFPHFTVDNDTLRLNTEHEQLIAAAAFTEVYLAKKGHEGKIGINLLQKVTWALPAAIYGAMAAGVDALFLGAGIQPKGEIHNLFDFYMKGDETEISIPVFNKDEKKPVSFKLKFDPKKILGDNAALKKLRSKVPLYGGIAGNHLGTRFLSDVDFFVLENNDAGGHNSPDKGEKGLLDLRKLKNGLIKNQENLDLICHQPYYFAGAQGYNLKKALEQGAKGIFLGSAYALCSDSGMDNNIRLDIINKLMKDELTIYTHKTASPTGYPIKVAIIEGSLSDDEINKERRRGCLSGCLSDLVLINDGETKKIVSRCPAGNLKIYKKRGGYKEDAEDARCLYESLMVTAGLRAGNFLVTLGGDLSIVKELVNRFGINYTAKDVGQYMRLDKAA